MTTSDQIHVFERAGLGRAPFRVLGVERRVGPITLCDAQGRPTNVQVGSPGQPMGSCAYCGQGIAECWSIRSADGKVFTVGCDCVAKTGDGGLRKQGNPHVRKLRNEAADARVAAAFELLASPAVQAALAAQEAPRGRGTALSWILFVRDCGGRAGKVKAARLIEAASSALPGSVDKGSTPTEAQP